MPVITKELISKVLDNYPLSINGIHGLSHWIRVRDNGLRLAELTGSNKAVVELFALFHDSQRVDEGKDLKHGQRGAEFAKTLNGSLFHLPENLFKLLYIACERHTGDVTHKDITIQTCFDADRLDLGRFGIIPDPDLLCTNAAKRKDVLNWAFINSKNGADYKIADLAKNITGSSNFSTTQENGLGLIWLHGATQYFENWKQPPIPSRLPEYLRPHSFISLSLDIKYAYLHKGQKGGICSASLLPRAKVLDLRLETKESLLLREKVLLTELGAKNRRLQTAKGWIKACKSGSIMRYALKSKDDYRELYKKYRIANSSQANSRSRFEANMYVHDFNRGWIELVIGKARTMGYDAVICNELEPEVNNETSTQLFVFDTDYLTNPVWVEYPHSTYLTLNAPTIG
jgi:uncharacterized protein